MTGVVIGSYIAVFMTPALLCYGVRVLAEECDHHAAQAFLFLLVGLALFSPMAIVATDIAMALDLTHHETMPNFIGESAPDEMPSAAVPIWILGGVAIYVMQVVAANTIYDFQKG